MTRQEFENLENGQLLIIKQIKNPIVKWNCLGKMDKLVGKTFIVNKTNITPSRRLLRYQGWLLSYDCLDFYEDTADNFNKRALKDI
jgi:hypothetical protein